MASNEEKIRFLKSKDGKDVVIKLSEYGSKLTSDGRVMYEINKSDEQAEQEQAFTPVIEHGMMNNWTVSVPNHSTANLNYIDWIAVETNYGIHIIQVGPQKGACCKVLFGRRRKNHSCLCLRMLQDQETLHQDQVNKIRKINFRIF